MRRQDSTSPTRLDRSAEARTYQLDDLLHELRDGKLRIPHFQRAQRWNDKDRVELFDSLYRGFPIGTLLFWKHAVPDALARFGDFQHEVKKRDNGLLIVDGQQRVTTLASILLVQPKPGARAIVFDLESETFRYHRIDTDQPALSPGAAPDPAGTNTTIPVYEVFDSRLLIRWASLRTRDLSDVLIQRALDCGKRLREYRIPVYVVESGDEGVLRTIFDRTNRTGRRLDDVDVFTALYATLNPGLDNDEESLRRIVRHISTRGFGRIKEQTVLKALRAVMDLPLDKDFTRTLRREDVSQALSRTEEALLRTVSFLRDEAGIPHQALLPYELPLVVLAKLFDRFNKPRRRNLILLRRYLWRGSLAGQMTGATIGLRRHVNAIGDDESDAVQELLALVSCVSIDLPLDNFSLATAKSKLAVCALAAKSPRHLITGAEIDVASLFEESISLPKIFTPKQLHEGSASLSKGLANRLLHPPLKPSAIVAALKQADPIVLASHEMDAAQQELLKRNQPDHFLLGRGKALRASLVDTLSARAELGADDSPPLDTLVIAEEP